MKDYFGKELSRDINPDEAVVFGTTIQAPVFSGQAGISVLDINPLTVGIEVNGGTFVPIIKRNTVIPTKKTMMYAVVFLGYFHFLMTSPLVSQLLVTTNVL